MNFQIDINTLLLILVTLFVAWIGYSNRILAKAISDLKEYVKEVNTVLFKELALKQDTSACNVYHDTHKELHNLEKDSNDKRLSKVENDNDNLGRMIRRK